MEDEASGCEVVDGDYFRQKVGNKIADAVFG